MKAEIKKQEPPAGLLTARYIMSQPKSAVSGLMVGEHFRGVTKMVLIFDFYIY